VGISRNHWYRRKVESRDCRFSLSCCLSIKGWKIELDLSFTSDRLCMRSTVLAASEDE